MADYVRRNEDRSQDERDAVKKEEIMQEDIGKMHLQSNGIITSIIRLIIWIAILFVAIQLISNLF